MVDLRPFIRVTSLPDNTVQTLSYVDLSTGQNVTCTDPCPLSTDASILYQDFLFASPVTLSGIQITLSEWTGAAPGLHMMQLLSSGAFASAISDGNTQSCFAPNPSNVTMTGTWTTKDASTDIPATLQTVLVSNLAVGTPSAQSPTFTWMPYVSASGQYEISLIIPGCADFQDCALRTSVQVTVFPGGGSQPYVTIVSQQNQEDAAVLVYSGPIIPSSSNFVVTVTMTIADNPAGNGENGQYELVAGSLELVLTSASVSTGSGPASSSTGSNSSIATQHGFGFFEWPLDSSSSLDATGVIPGTVKSSLDGVGVELYNALGAAISGTTEISSVIQHSSGIIFLGGSFKLSAGVANGASNIVAYKNGNLVALPNNGLNGAVSSFAIYGDELYVGGAFSDTQTPSTQGKLSGVAIYHISLNSWSTLGSGVDGPVADIAISNNQLQVTGAFPQTLSALGVVSAAGGLAVWDTKSRFWVNSGGFVRGNMTFVGNGTSSNGQGQSQFLAGRIQNMAKYGSTGFVMLSNDGSSPAVTPLGIELGTTNVSITSTTNQRRGHNTRGSTSWASRHLKTSLFSRQSTNPGSSSPLPSSPAPAPAVLAGAFWSNTTSSHEVAIIGGNFTFVTSSLAVSQGVAIFDPISSTIDTLHGPQIYGVVRALLVDSEQHLYVGGEFNLSVASANGFAIYDLAAQQWLTSLTQPLQASSGKNVVVRSITTSAYKPNTVVVAGTFHQAGTVSCVGICLLDTTLNQWSALGGGIQGDISSVSYAGVRSL